MSIIGSFLLSFASRDARKYQECRQDRSQRQFSLFISLCICVCICICICVCICICICPNAAKIVSRSAGSNPLSSLVDRKSQGCDWASPECSAVIGRNAKWSFERQQIGGKLVNIQRERESNTEYYSTNFAQIKKSKCTNAQVQKYTNTNTQIQIHNRLEINWLICSEITRVL